MSDVLTATGINLTVVLPELVLVGFAMLVMMADIFGGGEQSPIRRGLPWLAMIGLGAALLACISIWSNPIATFQGSATLDNFALGVKLIVLIAAALAILLSASYIPGINKQTGEYYTLLLLCSAAMMVMGSATDLMVVFLALEAFSLALYILTSINRNNPRSSEAGMKYFLLGAFASAFFAYGAALVYGATGSTQYQIIAATLVGGTGQLALLYPGIAMLIVGFGFKVSLVPFHMWTPDVYQGAPTPVTAFMSVGTKAAAFAAFIRVFLSALPAQHETWAGILAILAVITMTVGNFAALRQLSLKRMLAYSSIAHAGYILVGLTGGTATAASSAIFYLFSYAFMNIGAFAVIIMLEKAGEDDALQNRAAGIGKRFPMLALVMAIFMFSLTGIPPLAGFFGKLFVFKAAVDGGYAWLAVIAMLNSAVAAYYYLRVTVAMYFEEPTSESAETQRGWRTLNVGLAVAAIFTIAIGLYPGLWTGLFQGGIAAFGG
ncbi:MAG: NADH-quinone oxidoreductase subunit N [Caldilineaceae bacterium]|nr:NADH-quinone oxidoreductase subunit N [Caldilineaceae bacterium]